MNQRKLGNTTNPLWLLPLAFMAFAFLNLLGCSGNSFSGSGRQLIGVWIREGDEFDGMVMEIQPQDKESLEAVLLYAPKRAVADGFTIGDIKMRDIKLKPNGKNEFVANSLSRSAEHNSTSFNEGILVILNRDRIYWKDLAYTESIGSKQYWKRLDSGAPEMARVWYGKAVLDMQADRVESAISLMGKVAKSSSKDPGILNNVAWTLATKRDKKFRNPSAALLAAKRACELTNFRNAMYLDTLAAAYAANRKFEEATKYQAMALEELEGAKSEGSSPTKTQIRETFGWFQIEEGYRQWKEEFETRADLFAKGQEYVED